MNIQKVDNTVFCAKIKTSHAIEMATQVMFEPDGFAGMVNSMKKVYEVPIYTGWRGYRYYAEIAGRRIIEKYPSLAELASEVKTIIQANKNIPKSELCEKIYSAFPHIGEEVDIVI